MKGLKEKKGFTLIELLAVIVILAIITVIGITTILPYIQNAGKKAFVVEANNVIVAAQDAVTMYNFDRTQVTDMSDLPSCVTIEDLATAGLWDKDINAIKTSTNTSGKYEGKVEITQSQDGKTYSYEITMTDGTYYVAAGTKASSTDTAYVSGTVNDTHVQNSSPAVFSASCS